MMGLGICADRFLQRLSRQSHNRQQRDPWQQSQQSFRKLNWFCSEYSCRTCHLPGPPLDIGFCFFTTQYVSARPAVPALPAATLFPRPSRPVKVLFAASPLLLPRLACVCPPLFVHSFRPKQRAHSRLVSGPRETSKLLLPKISPARCA